MKFNKENYIYSDEYDFYLEISSGDRGSVQKKFLESFSDEVFTYLFSVEEEFQPIWVEKYLNRFIENIGCANHGCGYFSQNGSVIKITTDRTEAEFALSVWKEIDSWPRIFPKTHKVLILDKISIIWKEYALAKAGDMSFDDIFSFYDKDWKSHPYYIDDYSRLYNENIKIKHRKLLQEFLRELIPLQEKYGLYGVDFNTYNTGLSKEDGRILIFDYGGFSIKTNFKITEEYKNRIIDISNMK